VGVERPHTYLSLGSTRSMASTSAPMPEVLSGGDRSNCDCSAIDTDTDPESIVGDRPIDRQQPAHTKTITTKR
jgi:hypothetical protein